MADKTTEMDTKNGVGPKMYSSVTRSYFYACEAEHTRFVFFCAGHYHLQ